MTLGPRASERSQRGRASGPVNGAGRGRDRARSHPVSMMNGTPIRGRMARPGALCTRSVPSTPGLGSGASVGAPCTIPVTIPTHSRHTVAKKTHERPDSAGAYRPPSSTPPSAPFTGPLANHGRGPWKRPQAVSRKPPSPALDNKATSPGHTTGRAVRALLITTQSRAATTSRLRSAHPPAVGSRWSSSRRPVPGARAYLVGRRGCVTLGAVGRDQSSSCSSSSRSSSTSNTPTRWPASSRGH